MARPVGDQQSGRAARRLRPGHDELTLGELAAPPGCPVSTTYRLASELVEWGGLERVDGAGTGSACGCGNSASLAPRGGTLREVALPFMSDLYEATRENVHLAVRDGRDGALRRQDLRAPGDAGAHPARRAAAAARHGVGKVLLAHAPPESLFHETVAAGLRRYTAHTVIAPGHLRRALTEIRRSGIGYAREELTVGSHSVASGVLDADGGAVAALSVTLRSGRTDLRRLGPAVRTAAISVSRGLQERAMLAPVTRERPARALAKP